MRSLTKNRHQGSLQLVTHSSGQPRKLAVTMKKAIHKDQPFNPSKKQRLPPPRRNFGEIAGKRQHRTAFSRPSAKSGPPQAFRKAPPAASNQPSSDLHPSWAAKRQAQKAVVPFQGKKITFS
ncbi:hypothetical protein MRX96_048951 [Rhipicephalus microplus]